MYKNCIFVVALICSSFVFASRDGNITCKLDEIKLKYGLGDEGVGDIRNILQRDYVSSPADKPGKKYSNNEICELIISEKIEVKYFDSAGNAKEKNTGSSFLVDVLEESILYVKLTDFSSQSEQSFRELVLSKKWKLYRNIIIDIRGNKGGSLHNVLKISKIVGIKKQVIGHIRGSYRFTYKVDRGRKRLKGKSVLVLVDSETSSGAELFASYLKYNSMAIVAGEKTAGVSVVKVVSRLNDKVYLVSPTGYLYSPDEVVIHGNGVVPDIDVSGQECSEFHGLCREHINGVFN